MTSLEREITKKSISALYDKYYAGEKKSTKLSDSSALKIGITSIAVLQREAKIQKIHGWYAMTKEQLVICLDPTTTAKDRKAIADKAIATRYKKEVKK